MSPLVGSLFLIAMVSAIMSTVNSILLVTGGAFAHDLYKRLVNPRASQRRLIWVNRVAIVALGVVPFWFASRKLADVQTIVVEQAKFIASFFFVPVVLGLNWRRGTKEGAIWSMVAGFLGCLAWTFTFQRNFAAHGIDAGRGRRGAERADVHPRQPGDAADAGRESADLFRRAGQPEGCATGATEEDPVSTTTTFDIFRDEAVEAAARCRDPNSTDRARCSIGS